MLSDRNAVLWDKTNDFLWTEMRTCSQWQVWWALVRQTLAWWRMWRRWMRSQARISPRGSLRSPPSSLNLKVTMTVIRLEILLRMTLTWNVTSVVLCAWLFFSFFLCNFDYLQLLLCFLNIVILVCWKFEKFSELHDTCICYLTISSEVNNARSEYNTKKRKSMEF